MELLPSRAPLCFGLRHKYAKFFADVKKNVKKVSLQFELLNNTYSNSACKMSYTPDFPLIGSEKFYFPYTLNGFEFNPTERRNGILLNSADDPNCVANRIIVDKAVDAVLKFNEWLISKNATNRYLLASSRIPKSSEEYSERAATWIKNLQANWRRQLLQEKLVETENGAELLVNLSVPVFTPTSTKEINETFYNLLHGQYIGRGVLPAREYLHGWLEVIRPEYEAWGTKLKYEKEDFLQDLSALQNMDSLASKISKTRNEAIEWLNKVYKFLVDQNMLSEFDIYAIIPNQRGEFKLLKDLYSDQASRIPSILKDIYNSVNQDNATIQHILMDADVDASIFGNTLRSFSLKEMIDKLNEYVKTGSNFYKNGSLIDVRPTVAYSILALYPKTSDTTILNYRKSIYDFCAAYRAMNEYSLVDTAKLDLWKDSDNYWFNNSYTGISSKVKIASVANSFFTVEKTQEETLTWLNEYIQFYRNNSHGDLIKEQTVFPNQQLDLKKLSDLRYDDNIPEEFKDLAKVAYNPSNPIDVYRPQLLHRGITGYEQQNPLAIKDIYEYVKKRFDESNDLTKEAIARHTITILVKPESGEPEEKKLYDFAATISENTFEPAKYVNVHLGFNWGFAQEFYIKLLSKRIADSVNLEGFKKLSSTFIEKDNNQLTQWIDSFIEFLHSYKNKKFWTIATDKDNGIGIWLNQKNDFCKFQDVRKDEKIPEGLKNLCANNAHINQDFREKLFTLESSYSSYLETEPIKLSEIGEFIDNKIENYDGNKQDKDFRSLIFSIVELCKEIEGLEDIMTYFKATRNSLIVWSLGEGSTMDLVGSIVQQGDEKLEIVKDILENSNIDDLNELKQIVKDRLRKEGGYTIKVDNGQESAETATISITDTPYAGLSKDAMSEALIEAKAVVRKELEHQGYSFANASGMDATTYGNIYGVVDPENRPCPLVVHSYKNQSRDFELTAFDWIQLAQPNSMLYVCTNQGAMCVPFYKLMSDRGKINISFSTENANSKDRMIVLASLLSHFKGLHFDFGSLLPACSNVAERFNQPEKEMFEALSADDASIMM